MSAHDRASDFAGASTPLTRKEVETGVDVRDFTIRTIRERLQAVGDLWADLRASRCVDFQTVLEKAKRKM